MWKAHEDTSLCGQRVEPFRFALLLYLIVASACVGSKNM